MGEVVRVETIGVQPAAQYRMTFAPDAPAPTPGAELPAGWEGLYFPYDAPFSELRPDGSPARDGILPEFDLPRRMYAGEDAAYHRPLRYGDVVEQRVRPGSIVEKEGRGGRLVFADVVREYRVDGTPAIESVWHDVFLEDAPPGAPSRALQPGPTEAPAWREELTLDVRQLVRFSAITFNTHLVHVDRDWAREVEHLDDLLVHGPLTRILLLDAALRHAGAGARPASFAFRAHAPILVGTPVVLRPGAAGEVVALDAAGGLLASGTLVAS
jgi:3-methylfumaryl-CoA hydratase